MKLKYQPNKEMARLKKELKKQIKSTKKEEPQFVGVYPSETKTLKTYIRDEVKQARIQAIEEFVSKMKIQIPLYVFSNYQVKYINDAMDKLKQEMDK